MVRVGLVSYAFEDTPTRSSFYKLFRSFLLARERDSLHRILTLTSNLYLQGANQSDTELLVPSISRIFNGDTRFEWRLKIILELVHRRVKLAGLRR